METYSEAFGDDGFHDGFEQPERDNEAEQTRVPPDKIDRILELIDKEVESGVVDGEYCVEIGKKFLKFHPEFNECDVFDALAWAHENNYAFWSDEWEFEDDDFEEYF
jgi:hypothetical protein